MAKYRKKPVIVEARQVNSMDYDDLIDLLTWCDGRAVDGNAHLFGIETLEGEMFADHNDWIICGINGEFYPCKPDIFEATYEKVEDDD